MDVKILTRQTGAEEWETVGQFLAETWRAKVILDGSGKPMAVFVDTEDADEFRNRHKGYERVDVPLRIYGTNEPENICEKCGAHHLIGVE